MPHAPWTLVVPNTRYRDSYLWSVLPSRGLLCVAAALRARGVDVRYVDADLSNLAPAQVAERIPASGRPVVGVTVNTFQVAAALDLARGLRAARPDLFLVAGGPHASAAPEDLLDDGAFDAACVGRGGDGGGTRGRPGRPPTPRGCPGLAFRDGGAVRRTAPRAPIADLDTLPFPAYDLAGDLRRYPGALPILQPPSMHVMASRDARSDAPSAPTRSSASASGSCPGAGRGRGGDAPARLRRPRDLLPDDTMNLDRRWFLALCDEMTRRGLPATSSSRPSSA